MTTPESRPYVKAYWGNRARTPEQIAAAFRGTLDDLAALDPVLSNWWTRERVPVSESLEDLTRWVRLRYVKGPPEGLGYDVGAKSNGLEKSGYWFGVQDGNTDEHPIRLNDAELKPVRKHAGEDLLPRLGEAALEIIVTRWFPDWVSLASSELISAQRRERRRPVVGGLTWLADHLGDVPQSLPAGARVSRLDAGTLIDVREDDGALPDVDTVLALERALEEAGVLADIPQVQPERASATDS
jgi:hypothetical protein